MIEIETEPREARLTPMTCKSAISVAVLAFVLTAGHVSVASAQGAGSIDDLFGSIDNFIKGADDAIGGVDDIIDGAGDVARAGQRVGDDAADAAGDATRAIPPQRRLPTGVLDDIGDGAGDVARQAGGVAAPPPLRGVGSGIADQGAGAVGNAPGLARQGGGAYDAVPMLTDDIFEGFVKNADDAAAPAPRLATRGADAAGGADAVPGYTKPGAPAQMVDDLAVKPPVYAPAPSPGAKPGAVANAPGAGVYDDFGKIGKIKPAKPPMKSAAKNLQRVAVVDEFIVAPRGAVTAAKGMSKTKKLVIGGVVVGTTAAVGVTGYVLYETVGPVKDGIDTAVAATGEGLNTGYEKTNQGFATAGEALKGVFQPGDPASLTVHNNAGMLVEVYKVTASGDELLSSLSQDQETVVVNVAIGDKLSILKGGEPWATYDMTADTNGIEVVVQ